MSLGGHEQDEARSGLTSKGRQHLRSGAYSLVLSVAVTSTKMFRVSSVILVSGKVGEGNQHFARTLAYHKAPEDSRCELMIGGIDNTCPTES